MDPSEYYTYEDRAYIEPTLSRDEQLGFVDTLRDTIDKNTAQINTETQKLGTDISPNYGGLGGSNSYFKQRYQTTPVQAQTAALKSTAQAKALNDLMTNYQNQAANRYQQAYRRASARTSGGGSGGNGGSGAEDEDGDGLPDNVTTEVSDGGTQATVNDSDVTLMEPGSSEGQYWSNQVNGGGGTIGSGGQLPGGYVTTPYYYVLNGQNTGFSVDRTALGKGITTPTRTYGTRDAAIEFLKNIKSQGARIYNSQGKDITDVAIMLMGL